MTTTRTALILNLEAIIKLYEFPPGGSGSVTISLHTMQEIIEVLKFDEHNQQRTTKEETKKPCT